MESIIGPTYPYSKNIKNPKKLGVSSKGTFKALKNDVRALMDYVKVLVSGDSRASATGRPLGNKFFIKTGANCTDVRTGEEVERSLYINNVPSGHIPIISDLADLKLGQLRGLVPGIASNANALDPSSLLSVFTEGPVPDCQKVTLQTIDGKNKVGKGTGYVTLGDLRRMKSKNEIPKNTRIASPRTQESDEEGFRGIDESPMMQRIKDDAPGSVEYREAIDLLSNLGYTSVSVFLLYILVKIMTKK